MSALFALITLPFHLPALVIGYIVGMIRFAFMAGFEAADYPKDRG